MGSKILHAANVIAPILGAVSGFAGPPMAGGRGVDGAPAWIMERLKGFKIANPVITTEIALGQEDTYHLIADATAAVTGLIIKEVGNAVGSSTAERMGSALMKFGGTALTTGVVGAWVYEAVNNPHGLDGGPVSGQGLAYTPVSSTKASTIQIDNPQGLAAAYPGAAPANYAV